MMRWYPGPNVTFVLAKLLSRQAYSIKWPRCNPAFILTFLHQCADK